MIKMVGFGVSWRDLPWRCGDIELHRELNHRYLRTEPLELNYSFLGVGLYVLNLRSQAGLVLLGYCYSGGDREGEGRGRRHVCIEEYE